MLRRNKEQQALIDFTKELEGIFEEFYEFQLEDITLAYQSVNINHFWNDRRPWRSLWGKF